MRLDGESLKLLSGSSLFKVPGLSIVEGFKVHGVEREVES